jgi:hypothetical protein
MDKAILLPPFRKITSCIFLFFLKATYVRICSWKLARICIKYICMCIYLFQFLLKVTDPIFCASLRLGIRSTRDQLACFFTSFVRSWNFGLAGDRAGRGVAWPLAAVSVGCRSVVQLTTAIQVVHEPCSTENCNNQPTIKLQPRGKRPKTGTTRPLGLLRSP